MKRVPTKHTARLAIGALIVSGLLGFTAVGASAATSFFNGFETDTTGWYGFSDSTITRVPSGDASAYASGIDAATDGYFARLGLDQTPGSCVNGGGTQPLLRGPYTDFGGDELTFPTGGYSTGLDVYLDVSYATAHPDTRFDWSSAINDPSGNTRRDFMFNASTEATGFVIDGGTNGDRCGANPAGSASAVHIATSGWYTLKHTFTGVSGGQLSVQMDLIAPGGAVVGSWTRSDASDIIGSTVGGHAYGWFVQNELPGLAIDNTRLAPLTPPPPSADLSVSKSGLPLIAHVGQKLTYTIPVTNNGPDTANTVTLTDTLPKSTGFGSASATHGGTCTRSKMTVTCTWSTLANGATETATIVVKPTQKGTITNTVTVSAASPTDPNTANNTATATTTVKP
jgi:uncharacterized repeat protein (TIGR01451 family)